MVVSVDHIGASRMWSNFHLDKFNFYMMQIDTYLAYDKEFNFQPALFADKNDNQELGLAYILKSMTEL